LDGLVRLLLGAATWVGSFPLGFVGTSPFRRETQVFRGWILLDFLGFSRLNRDLSMGYEEKTTNFFLGALSGNPPGNSAYQRNAAMRIAHEASLADILFPAIVCLSRAAP
jgi:hypothetical protein